MTQTKAKPHLCTPEELVRHVENGHGYCIYAGKKRFYVTGSDFVRIVVEAYNPGCADLPRSAREIIADVFRELKGDNAG